MIKDNDEECVMHSKSDNIEIMMNDKADEIIEEIFDQLLFYKCHKINPNRGGLYIDSSDWIKK